MSFPRDAILGTGFAPQGRASPIAPDARPIYNKRESPIRTIGDLLRVQLPHLWPKIQANCAKQPNRFISLNEPLRPAWTGWSAREILSTLFTWSETPEGHDFWLAESTADCSHDS